MRLSDASFSILRPVTLLVLWQYDTTCNNPEWGS